MPRCPTGRSVTSGLSGQAGMVLVLILIVMTVGIGLVFYISAAARETVRSTSLLEDKLRAKLEAESQLELLRFLLATNPFQHSHVELLDRTFDPSLPARLSLRGDSMRWHNSVVTLRDTASMLTVPWCDPDFLQRYLLARGVSRDKATRAADTWLDWLDRDDLKHLNGAEVFDYHVQGVTAWTPRNSLALQAKEESWLVCGLRQSGVWQEIEPELVWTVRGGGNIHTASRAMLQALLDIPFEQAEQLVVRRAEQGMLTRQDVLQITGKSIRPARGERMDFPNFIVAVHVRSTVGEAGEQLDAVLDVLPGDTAAVTILRYEP